MKATLLLLFVTLTFVPFAFPSRQLPSSSSASGASVIDIEGKELQLGLPYNALSKVFIFQPGLCLIDIKNQTKGCSHDVVQCSIFSKSSILGWPIIFNTPANVTAGNVVKEGISYTVRFPVSAAGLLCIQEIFWGLADVDVFRKYVTTDPTAGVGGALFQVQKEWSGYKIAYCVTIPVPRVPVCYPVGLIQQNGYNRLGIGFGVKPLQFTFSKYNATTPHAHATF
ncbi:PREDICTED: serine protease inhibitor 2-like [Ipomoea nil]|uniref:serine protease inhibitor 2-like n=1 Tax=Ipomoea nil TaxID=35883 RepID=UPI0009012577|nr:PREDICTED: serine protease inhibitor 2-like [Ipomoea nil]